ncbi:MAG: hypothetical protein JWP87_63 [Labilithrix sp.]|nr:hypothetical protein [Labilithrix sp.]
MDRLIRTAWRAFWVGLGASAVLIGQSVLQPAPGTANPAEPSVAPLLAPAAPVNPPAAQRAPSVRRRSADPILSRNPFDSTTGPLSRCETIANVTRCT